MRTLQAGHARQPFTADNVAVYVRLLEDLPYETTFQIVCELIQTSRFRPEISEIRSAAAERLWSLPAPDEAWAEVRRAIQGYGTYNATVPEWSEPIIKRAVDFIGWSELTHAEDEEAARIMRSQWLKHYAELREAEMQKRQIGPPITGGEVLSLASGGSSG